MARQGKKSDFPPKYSTTEAARLSMPRNIAQLEDIRDNAKSEIARVQAIALLAKLAKLDQLPDVVDLGIEIETIDQPKVISLASENTANAVAN
jgi:hypothetical protein